MARVRCHVSRMHMRGRGVRAYVTCRIQAARDKDAVVIVGVITLGAFVSLFNQTVMAPALPALMREFGVTAGAAQWVTTIYMLVSGIMVPISGYFMDKYPTRKLFFLSMGLFVAGTVMCALCPSYLLLIAGRVLQAAGAGILMPLVGTVPCSCSPSSCAAPPWVSPAS